MMTMKWRKTELKGKKTPETFPRVSLTILFAVAVKKPSMNRASDGPAAAPRVAQPSSGKPSSPRCRRAAIRQARAEDRIPRATVAPRHAWTRRSSTAAGEEERVVAAAAGAAGAAAAAAWADEEPRVKLLA